MAKFADTMIVVSMTKNDNKNAISFNAPNVILSLKRMASKER